MASTEHDWGTYCPPAVIHGAGAGAVGGVVGARGIIEKTMAIVLGPVISTPKSGSLQAEQRPGSFLTSWGCGEVTTGSFGGGLLYTYRRPRVGPEEPGRYWKLSRVHAKYSPRAF